MKKIYLILFIFSISIFCGRKRVKTLQDEEKRLSFSGSSLERLGRSYFSEIKNNPESKQKLCALNCKLAIYILDRIKGLHDFQTPLNKHFLELIDNSKNLSIAIDYSQRMQMYMNFFRSLETLSYTECKSFNHIYKELELFAIDLGLLPGKLYSDIELNLSIIFKHLLFVVKCTSPDLGNRLDTFRASNYKKSMLLSLYFQKEDFANIETLDPKEVKDILINYYGLIERISNS